MFRTEAQRTLRYGDKIVLKPNIVERCFLSCEGFHSRTCDLQMRRDPELSRNAERTQTSGHISDCIFEVHLKSLYIQQKAYEKFLARFSDDIDGERSGNMQRLNQERLSNASEHARHVGTEVLYGQTMQLRHVRSGLFLAVTACTPAETDRSCLQSCLEEGSEHAWFDILPRFKAQQEGDVVYINDMVQFLSSKGRQLLHVGTSLLPNNRFEANFSPRSMHTINPHRVGWRVLLHSAADENSKTIMLANTPFRIFHKESSNFLASQLTVIDNSPVSQSPFGSDFVCLQGKKATMAFSSNTIWEAEFEHNDSGGPVYFGSRVRFRQVVTGRHLTVSLVASDIKSPASILPPIGSTEVTSSPRATTTKRATLPPGTKAVLGTSYRQDDASSSSSLLLLLLLLLLSTHTQHSRATTTKRATLPPGTKAVLGTSYRQDDASVFTIVPPHFKGDGKVQWSDLFFLQHAATGVFIHALPTQEASKTEHELSTVQHLTVDATQHDSDMFTARIPDPQDISEALLLVGARRAVSTAVEQLSQPTAVLADMRELVLPSLRRMLAWLLNFLVPLDRNVIRSQDGAFRAKHKLKFFREIGFFESLIRLLRFPSQHRGDVFSANPWIMDLFRDCYAVLEVAVSDKKNAVHLSRYTSLLQQQLRLRINKGSLLVSLYRNNPRLQHMVKEENIQYLVQLCSSEDKVPEYLHMLSVLCTCDKEGVGRNQRLVAAAILSPDSAGLLIRFSLSKSDLVVEVDGVQQVFHSYWKSAPAEKRQFMFEFLDLLTSVCVDANLTAQAFDQIRAIVPYEALVCVLVPAKGEQSKFPDALRCRVMALMISLYVNNERQFPITDTAQVFSWGALQTMLKPPTHEDDIDFGVLTEYLVVYLKENRIKKASKPARNDLTLQVLRLLRLLILFGYYAQPPDIDRLVPLLLGILSPDTDLHDDARSEAAFSLFVEESKVELCTILHLLFDLRLSLRLRVLLRHSANLIDQNQDKLSRGLVGFPDRDLDFTFLLERLNLQESTQDLVDTVCSILKRASDCAPLATSALHLLVRHFTQSAELVDVLPRVVLLTSPTGEDVFWHVRSHVLGLRRSVRACCTSGVFIEDAMHSMDDMQADLEALVVAMCPEGGLPRAQAQELVFSLDSHTEIIELLRSISMDHQLYLGCHRFLQAFCMHNPSNQSLIFETCLDLLLSQLATDEAVSTLQAVFRGAHNLCTALKLRHFRIILAALNPDHRSPRLLKLLEGLVCCAGVPVSTGQVRVVKGLMERSETVFVLYDSPDERLLRQGLLRVRTSEADSFVAYHVALVDLLASCARGAMEHSVMFCQSKLSLEHIHYSIVDAKDNTKMKHAFLRALDCIYAQDPSPATGKYLTSSDHVWQILDVVRIEILDLCREIGGSRDGKGISVTVKGQPHKAMLRALFSAALPCVTNLFQQHISANAGGVDADQWETAGLLASAIHQLVADHTDLLSASQIATAVAALEALLTCPITISSERASSIRASITKLTSAPSLVAAKPIDSLPLPLSPLPASLQADRAGPDNGRSPVGDVHDDSADSSESLNAPLRAIFASFKKQMLSIQDDEFLKLVVRFVPVSKRDDDIERPRRKSVARTKVEVLDAQAPGIDADATNEAILGHLQRIVGQLPHFSVHTQAPVMKRLLRLLTEVCTYDLGMSSESTEEEQLQFSSDREKRQKFLCEAKAPQVMSWCVSTGSDDIFQDAVALGIALLEGGNRVMQDAYFEHLTKAECNFFGEIREHLRAAGVLMKQSMKTNTGQSHSARRTPPQWDASASAALSVQGVGVGCMLVSSLLAVPSGDGGGAAASETCSEAVTRILELLQLFSESQHTGLQNLLRDQSQHGYSTSVDLVGETVRLLGVLERFLSSKTTDVVTQVFDTLNELCINCPENKQQLIHHSTDFFVVINRILKRSFTPIDEGELKQAKRNNKASAIDQTQWRERLEEVCDAMDLQQSVLSTLRCLLNAVCEEDSKAIFDALSTEGLDAIVENCNKLGNSERLEELLLEVNDILFAEHLQGAERLKTLAIDVAFNSFCVLSVLADNQPHNRELPIVLSNLVARDYFLANTGRIEIQRGEELQRVYFPVNPAAALELTDRTKVKVLWEVDRSSPASKISDFRISVHNVLLELEHRIWIARYSFLNILVDNLFLWQDFSLLLALILNTLVIYSYGASPTGANKNPGEFNFMDMTMTTVDPVGDVVINFFGIIQTAMSVIMILSHLLTHAPVTVAREKYSRLNRKYGFVRQNSNVPSSAELVEEYPCWSTFKRGSLFLFPEYLCFVSNSGASDMIHLKYIQEPQRSVFWRRGITIQTRNKTFHFDLLQFPVETLHNVTACWKYSCDTNEIREKPEMAMQPLRSFSLSLLYCMRTPMFGYYVWYIGMSLMGNIYSPFFFAFHLLDILTRSELLKNVLKAVTVNGKSILLTVALMFVVVYFYGILGFFFFRDRYKVGGPPAMTFKPDATNVIDEAGIDGPDPEYFLCNTLFWCIMSHLSIVIRNGGTAIAEEDPCMVTGDCPGTKDTQVWTFIRFIYDISFFAIVITILLNIIFGIIIDTFGELRSDKKAIEEDIADVCFICSQHRRVFDSSGYGFERHIKSGIEGDHNMWNYLFFLQHLTRKPQTKFDAPEAYVYNLFFKKDEMTWLPTHKAMALMGTVEEEADTAARVTELEAAMNARFDQITQAIVTLSEKLNSHLG